MTTVKSDKRTIQASAEKVYDKLSNLDNLKPLLENLPEDKIPADKMEMFRNLKITSDTISFPAAPVGEITLRVTDRLPYSLIRLQGEGTPVALDMQLEIDPLGADECQVQVSINLDIPIMLRPMVSGPLKKVVDQFSQVLGAIPFN